MAATKGIMSKTLNCHDDCFDGGGVKATHSFIISVLYIITLIQRSYCSYSRFSYLRPKTQGEYKIWIYLFFIYLFNKDTKRPRMLNMR